MALRIFEGVFIAALLVSGLVQAESGVESSDRSSVAQFKIGDSDCVLQDDQIRCTRVGR